MFSPSKISLATALALSQSAEVGGVKLAAPALSSTPTVGMSDVEALEPVGNDPVVTIPESTLQEMLAEAPISQLEQSHEKLSKRMEQVEQGANRSGETEAMEVEIAEVKFVVALLNGEPIEFSDDALPGDTPISDIIAKCSTILDNPAACLKLSDALGNAYGHSAEETLEAAAALNDESDPLMFTLSVISVEPQSLKLYGADSDATAHLDSDGNVTTTDMSGIDSSTVRDKLVNVKRLYKTEGAFAALKEDGSVVAWGHKSYGGSAPTVGLTEGVIEIVAGDGAFAALKEDGSVVAWGHEKFGGSAPTVGLENGVTQIVATRYAFAALKADGSVVAWGDKDFGGSAPTGLTEGVTAIVANGRAFAAVKSDSSIIAWGGSEERAELEASLDSRV